MKVSESLNAPISGCLNPRIIINSAGEKMLVPCNHCVACTLKKSNMYTQLCRLESMAFAQSWFITLTYDEFFVPRVEIKSDVDNLQYSFNVVRKGYVKTDSKDFSDDASYLVKSFKTLSDFLKFDDEIKKMQKKVGNENIPILYKKDLQRFLYKLRNYFKKHSYGKLRYFAVGEYGPEHLRPHFHLLLWLEVELEDLFDYFVRTHGRDRKFTSSTFLDEAISSCWKYGRQTSELSKGYASQYTAGYATSYNYIPLFLRESLFKPFQCHSNGLGRRFFDSQRDVIYETGGFEALIANLSTNYSKIVPSAGVQTAYFPKCYGYSSFTYEMRFALYMLYERTSEIYKAKKVSEISKEVFSDLYEIISSSKDFISRESTWFYNNGYEVFLGYDPSVYRDVPTSVPCDRVGLMKFLLKFVELSNLDIDNDAQFVYDFISRQIRLSKHFLEFCCLGDSSKARHMLSLIDSYYQAKSLKQLNDSYYFQENCPEHLVESSLFDCMYDDSFDIKKLQSTTLYKFYHRSVGEQFDNRIKHKKINDKMNLFKI